MKSVGAEFVRPDALPSVNQMRGMQFQKVLNIAFCPESSNTVVYICVHKTSRLI